MTCPRRASARPGLVEPKGDLMDVTSNGTTLYAERSGRGRPLVFVHGMCGSADVWRGQVERLSGDFECVAYDRRGHSRSPRTDAAETVELHGDDLAGLIGSLGLEGAVAVGSSGGARVVVDLLRRHPGAVAGAVISEPPLAAVAPDEFAAMIGQIAPSVQAAVAESGPRASVDAFMGAMCPGLWDRLDEPGRDAYRANADMLFADLGTPIYAITEADVRAIEVPVLVIEGTTSFSALQTVAERLAQWLPSADLVRFPGGHVTYAEEPDRFADAVRSLASRV